MGRKETRNKNRKALQKERARGRLNGLICAIFAMVMLAALAHYLLRSEAGDQALDGASASELALDGVSAGELVSDGTTAGNPASGEETALPALPVLTGSERAEAIGFDLSQVPPYEGKPNVPVNGNIPFFTEEEITTQDYEEYYPLDRLGRCTGAMACAGESLMPTGQRERLTEVKPTGWNYAKYEGIDGNYLFNRCHLIAYGLTAENLNWENLITGTRYMNTEGMNSYENDTISYIRRTGHHVMYRATPIFEGENLIASGILLEAKSVEDDALQFCIYAYNVQPGITIDYLTGASERMASDRNSIITDILDFLDIEKETEPVHKLVPVTTASEEFEPPADDVTYVINAKTGKFHLPNCDSVREMNQKNRWDYTGSREALIEDGYTPCGACHP